jgi:hypothetical protein
MRSSITSVPMVEVVFRRLLDARIECSEQHVKEPDADLGLVELQIAVFEVKAHVDMHMLVRSIVGRTSGPTFYDADARRHTPG